MSDARRPPPAPNLEPWLPVVRDAVTAALCCLLDLPDSLSIHWSADPTRPGLQIVAQIGTPGLELALGDLDPARQVTWRGRFLAVDVRAGELTPRLRQRLQLLDAEPTPAVVTELRAAWHRWQAIGNRQDHDFRVFSGGAAELRLGFRCNQDCDFCFQGRDWTQPPLDLQRRWLAQMLAARPERLVLSGGEPSLYMNELLEFAETSRQSGVPVYVQSNAIRLGQPHVLDALVAAGIQGVLASYHSADAVVSDLATRAPGTHVRTELGIVAALRAGLHVDLNAVVDLRTLPGLVARSQRIVAEFLPAARDAAHLSVSFAFPTNYHDRDTYRRAVAPLDLVAPVLVEAIGLLRAAGVQVAPLGSCGFPLCALRGLPAAIDLGPMRDIAAEHGTGRTHPPICQTCALLGSCNGPRREYLDVHGQRGLVPFARLPHAPAATPEHVARLLAEASAVTSIEQSGQIEIQLGHFCNNRCVFCASGQLTEQGVATPVADTAVARALDAAAARGLTRVTFLGGEPTIQDSFLPSLAHARRVGLRDITIFTNGSRTWDVRFLDAVLAAGPVKWRISIQGGDAASHDAIVVKKGAFERIIKGLKLLRARDQDVTVNMCLTTEALPALAELGPLVLAHGVRQLCIDMVRPVSAGDRTEAWLHGIMPRFSLVTPQLRALLAVLDRDAPGYDVNLTHVPFCVMPDEAHRLHHGGEPTVTFTADLAERQGAMDKYAFQASDRRLMPQCDTCVFRPRCTGVPHAYLAAYGDSEFVAVTAANLLDLDPRQHALVDGMMSDLEQLQAIEPGLSSVVADPRMRRIELRHELGTLWIVPAIDPVPAGLWPVARAARWQMALQPGAVSVDLRPIAARLARQLDSQAQMVAVDLRRGAFAHAWLEAAISAWQAQPSGEFQVTAVQRQWAAVTVTVSHRGRTGRLRLAPDDDAKRQIHSQIVDTADFQPSEWAAVSRWLGRSLRAVRPRG